MNNNMKSCMFKTTPRRALIVAFAQNRVIGNKGSIPWKIKGEQLRFKKLTVGNVVIMGRRSYEEIGHPLPDRYTIVVSSTVRYEAENCTTVTSLEEALKKAENKNVYISGGARLYQEAISLVDEMYITEIEAEVQGDTFFPDFKKEDFIRIVEEKVEGAVPYTHLTYIRKTSLIGTQTIV